MEYIKVEDNIVVELVSCRDELDGDWIPVDIDGGLQVGDDVRMYDKKWRLRRDEDIMNEGLIDLAKAQDHPLVPDGTIIEKVVDGEIVHKTKYDYVKEGTLELGAREYINHQEKDVVVAGSVEELMEHRDLDSKTADSLKAEDVRRERDNLLLSLDNIVTNPLRWESLNNTQKKKHKTYRQKLLDLPEQKGFPWDVEWPKLDS